MRRKKALIVGTGLVIFITAFFIEAVGVNTGTIFGS